MSRACLWCRDCTWKTLNRRIGHRLKNYMVNIWRSNKPTTWLTLTWSGTFESSDCSRHSLRRRLWVIKPIQCRREQSTRRKPVKEWKKFLNCSRQWRSRLTWRSHAWRVSLASAETYRALNQYSPRPMVWRQIRPSQRSSAGRFRTLINTRGQETRGPRRRRFNRTHRGWIWIPLCTQSTAYWHPSQMSTDWLKTMISAQNQAAQDALLRTSKIAQWT